jgi:hypothetical protein
MKDSEKRKVPLTNKEKQAAFRERRTELGQKELRGIWVSSDEEKEIKPKIHALIKKLRS